MNRINILSWVLLLVGLAMWIVTTLKLLTFIPKPVIPWLNLGVLSLFLIGVGCSLDKLFCKEEH